MWKFVDYFLWEKVILPTKTGWIEQHINCSVIIEFQVFLNLQETKSEQKFEKRFHQLLSI